MLTRTLLALATLVVVALPPLLAAPPPVAAEVAVNLLVNGGFEEGAVGWSMLAGAEVVTAEARSGARSARIGGQSATQEWVAVTPGETYVLTAWVKWAQFSGEQWGRDQIMVEDDRFTTLGLLAPLHAQLEPGRWQKVGLTFVPARGRVRVTIGMFGPQDAVEIYFDDLSLFQRATNQPPSASPAASVSVGEAPLAVSFQARADDADGAVAHYQWLFGDGGEAREADPTHVYRSRGQYSVVLNVWDHDGAVASRTLILTVSDGLNPTVTISTPSGQPGASLTAAEVSLAGEASTPSGVIIAVSWDNLRTGAAGALAVTPGASLSWATPPVALAAGANEILVSAVDSRGRAGSARIVVTREVAGPQIADVAVRAGQVRVYEKYEVAFQVATVAEHPLFAYDEAPPPGVAPGAGVTVEGLITTPSGRTLHQPAFYAADVRREGVGERRSYAPAGAGHWLLRFAPTERGAHRVALRVQDASGVATAEVGSFTATAPARAGFIGVSKEDPRYFRFSNGALYWPIGPAWAADYRGGEGFNLDRPWLAGMGIYTTNWARWKSTAQRLGNEGFSSQLSFREHYPGHELSQELFYPDGYRVWIGCFLDDAFCHRLRPSTVYQVKLRVKVVGLAGPRDPAHPFGLVVKLHGWPEEPGFEAASRDFRSLVPRISADRDWHTVVASYTTGPDEGGAGRNDVSIYLENVTAGRAYIDAFSIRELLPGGEQGPELVRNPLADLHTYVEQRPAAAVDDQLAQAEADGIFMKYVVHDKNDWIGRHLLAIGIFDDVGDDYYQGRGTKARWLLEQWWRYLGARWGYSTAVHSWELNNEGPPDDGSGAHAPMAQDFARFMREQDVHAHPATTSFWCCWEPTFWGDGARFPDVAYADVHQYVGLGDRFADGTPVVYDEARFQAESSLAYSGDRVGKPIVRGELGFVGEPTYSQLRQPNPGVWFHNLLWAQLNAGAVFDPGYWFREHMDAIDAAAQARPFAAFVATLDVHRGGYVDAAPQVSNPLLRAYGQKHPGKGKAHLWVQNSRHTWRNVMGVDDPAPITPQSGVVTLTLAPRARYSVEWWDTYAGTVTRREVLATDEAGALRLVIEGLAADLAVKVVPEGYREPGAGHRAVLLPAVMRGALGAR